MRGRRESPLLKLIFVWIKWCVVHCWKSRIYQKVISKLQGLQTFMSYVGYVEQIMQIIMSLLHLSWSLLTECTELPLRRAVPAENLNVGGLLGAACCCCCLTYSRLVESQRAVCAPSRSVLRAVVFNLSIRKNTDHWHQTYRVCHSTIKETSIDMECELHRPLIADACKQDGERVLSV